MKNASLILYPAADLAAATTFFRELTGADPYVDSPHYVGFKSDDMEIGLVPSAEAREGAVAYWTVSDIAAGVKALADAGGAVLQEITDVGFGMLVAKIGLSSGTIVGLRQLPSGQSA